ncbi:MAG: hypothetical protein H7Y00_12655 [Fimbriimonadaceae bacterium]|nr:hypothetical protein [Chitinophagales bacterium]
MRKNLKAAVILIIVSFAASVSFAQEFIGLRTDNFSGSNGMLLNPAAPLSGSLPWDVNIIAGGISAYNNYLYLENTNTFSAMNADSSALNFKDVNQVRATENAFLQLPSAFFKTGDFAFGFFITGRSAASVISDTYPPGINSLQNIPFDVPTTLPKFDVVLLNWMEVGVNGEMLLQEAPSGNIIIGANLKFLGGFEGINFHNNEELIFTRGEINTDITNLDATYAFTENAGGGNFTNLNLNGWGIGTDLGIIYTINGGKRKSYHANYNWKLGASLVDMGFIRFNDEAGKYALNSETAFEIVTAELDSIDDLIEFNRTGSRTLYDFAQASKTGDKFTNMLPAAINLSADYNIGKGFFVSAMITRRINFINENMVARANTIYIAPRYENRFFGFTAPVSLYEDRFVHVGAAARIFFLTIGSDDLVSWINKSEYNGTDFYAGIKINPIWLSNSKNDKKYKASKQLDCKGPINPNGF